MPTNHLFSLSIHDQTTRADYILPVFFALSFCRIDEEFLSLQKRQKDLLGEWKNSCNSTLKWIADTSARVQAQDTTAPDLDHARAQRQEIEVRNKTTTSDLFN